MMILYRPKSVPQPAYELIPKSLKPDNAYVNMERNPSYLMTDIQDSSVDHYYDIIPGSDNANAKKKETN